MADPKPNISFIGKKDGRDPLMLINNGDTAIVLPDNQDEPFFHNEAPTIVRLFPYLYKKVLPIEGVGAISPKKRRRRKKANE